MFFLDRIRHKGAVCKRHELKHGWGFVKWKSQKQEKSKDIEGLGTVLDHGIING